jgi:dienelactone hydrolase
MTQVRVPYEYDGREFEGMLVYDDAVSGKRPALFMQPDWLGVCAHSADMAAQAGGSDFVMMVADMFGKGYGDVERTQEELGKIARGTRADLPFVQGCGAAAYAAMTAEADRLGLIDTNRIGATGYCMGGGFVLEQARTGADFKGVVVFHVTLPNPVDPDAVPNFKGRILAIHGSADSITPKPQMDALEAEFAANGVDWQLVNFGHALHSFCVLGADSDTQRYDDRLCKQSYRLMRDFFTETF